MTEPELLSLAEAVRQLRDPAATEQFSPLGRAPLLAVDLRDAAKGQADAAALVALSRLPCPTVALSSGSAPDEVTRWFDVVLEDASALAPLHARIAAVPVASMVLVQLLRQGERLGVEDALVAESFAYSLLQAGPEFRSWLAARGPRGRRAEEEGPPVRAEREGPCLRILLDRPRRCNAYSRAMRDGLVEALEIALADATVANVELRGAGPAFCSGGDLDEFGTLPDPATAHAVRTTRSAARLLAACTDRVHAFVHGACIGAGVELPAFAGRVTASPDAFFELPEVAMGLVPGAGGTASLPRRIGRQRTAWLALTGARIDAATALRIGLVDTVASGPRGD